MRFRLLAVAALCATAVVADEGMWPFNQFPKDRVEKKYGFKVSDEFLNHLRLSSLRMGASASFVSPNGLIFTNHHVASGCIHRLSSAGHNYMANGFYAAKPEDEMKCSGMEANVLLRIEDVTQQVTGAVKARAGTPEANQQRLAAIANIEKACAAQSGNRCDVVTLYSGAQYQLYEYRKYTDIRLVFAPEEAIAFFGGDPDNFTYPRYDLDITFVRAYENGRPANTPNYLKWSKDGPQDGELTFVSGNPGSTDRFITYSQMQYMRDTSYPMLLRYYGVVIRELKAYGAKSAENKRVARAKLFGAENTYKARFWETKGLNDPRLFAEKARREKALSDAIAKNPKVAAEVGNAFEAIAAAYKEWTPRAAEAYFLEGGPRFSDLFRIARTVYRMPVEKAKPNGERLREFTDASLPSLELGLYAQSPIEDSLETLMLATWFRTLEKELPGNAVVKAVLKGRTPEQAAAHYVGGTKLKDIAERKRLAGSADAGKSSADTMIELARILDGPARAMRKQQEDRLEAVERPNSAKIARARFAVFGATDYPDATFTLRLSYGAVKSYKNAESKPVSWMTDFAGMYRHATGEDPFKLPESFVKAKEFLNPSVPLNFVTTCDIIGGNSGSPTVNTKGEITGIIFDSNIEAMPNRFVYDERMGRAVHVAGPGIIEALRKVYKAGRVLEELGFAK